MNTWSEEIIEALGLPLDGFSTHELRCVELMRMCHLQYSSAFMASFCMIPSEQEVEE
tara:strand:- start:1436 stop:1606 length:171 start_codon:yes stop_codon:yes gene_type:complete